MKFTEQELERQRYANQIHELEQRVQELEGAMTTVVIQIGNSDNKLTQSEWAHYCAHMGRAVKGSVRQVHFSGGSDWDAPWQNACWVCEVDREQVDSLRREVSRCGKNFGQESVAVTFGQTEFV